MKILLIQPAKPLLQKKDGSREGRQAMFPLGLLYLAAAAEQQGHRVEVLDIPTEGFSTEEHLEEVENGVLVRIGLPLGEVARRIADSRPDVVGISCLLSTSAAEAMKCAQAVKLVNPHTPVVMGGAHPSALPKEVLAEGGVDYVVLGEGEETFCSLLACIEQGRRPGDIDGLAFIERGTVVVNPKTKWIRDLDGMPWPARHLVNLKTYVENYHEFAKEMAFGHTRSVERGLYTPMLSSRGCPYNCYFCAKSVVWGHRYRTRAPEAVVDEMEHLVREYGVEEIHFEDENWAGSRGRAARICEEIIRRRLEVAWAVSNGLTLHAMSEELLRLMKAAGAYSVTMSLESGCERVCRELIDKPLSREKAKQMIGVIKELGLDLFVCFMMGFPGETVEEIYATVRFAEELDIDKFGFALVTPLPGTQLLEQCERQGLLVENFDKKRLRFSVGNIVTDQFTPELLEKIRREEYLRIHRQRTEMVAAGRPSP